MSRKLLAIPAEATVRAAGNGSGSGVPRFKLTANTGWPMKLPGWKHPVVLDLQGVQIPRDSLPIRLNHDVAQGLGHTTKIEVKGGKLTATGFISRATKAADEVKVAARNGFPFQASVGASADDVEFVREGETALANNREYQGPVNIARRSTLGEISIVDSGADPHTEALIAARRGVRAVSDARTVDEIELEAERHLHEVKRGIHSRIAVAKVVQDAWLAEQSRQESEARLRESIDRATNAHDQIAAVGVEALEEMRRRVDGLSIDEEIAENGRRESARRIDRMRDFQLMHHG